MPHEQATDTLRLSEERFRRLSATVPVGIFETDLEGHCLYTNRRWQEIAGLSFEQTLGDGWRQAVHPEDRDAVTREWMAAAAARKDYSQEFRMVRPTGEVRWVRSRSAVMYDGDGRPCGHVGTTEDITETRRAEQDRDRFVLLSHDFLCVAGFDGYFKKLSPAWSSLGYSTEELLAVPLTDFMHPDDREPSLRQIAELGQGRETMSFEARFQRRDGENKYLLWDAIPVPGEGLIYAIGRDIGPLKAIERMREDFVAMMSHDIKSPLGCVLGFLSLLRDEPEDSAMRAEYFDRVEASAHRAVTLATNFLDVSRIHASALELFVRPASVNDIIRHAVRHHESAARIRKVTVDLELDPEVPLIDGDEPLLDRVIVNLLNNAIKFSPEGGRVTLRTHMSADGLEIEVMDGGKGVPEGERTNVFNKYVRMGTHRREGTGLGLFIVKAIVEAHGGTVGVGSSVGGGAAFWVRLPLTRSA